MALKTAASQNTKEYQPSFNSKKELKDGSFHPRCYFNNFTISAYIKDTKVLRSQIVQCELERTMKCLYYLSPNLDICKKVSDDLHDIGVDDWYLHVISKDESGLTQQHIHSSNYLETLDLYRGTTVGGALGFVISLIIIAVMEVIQPFGPGVPGYVYMIILALTTMFGIWEGGLYGIDTENQKIAPFHDEIEAGKYLVLVYTDKNQGSKISQMMNERHPESELVASDTHYINPFSKLKRI